MPSFAPDNTDARPRFAFLAVLVGITAIGPLSMQIFLPALPAIQSYYGVDPAAAQLTLSLSMAAIAVATLAYGPISDRFGRRPVLFAGLILFLVGSAACAVAPTILWLIVGRVVQAAGATCGMVLARAIVRDVYAAEKVPSVLAYLTMAMVVAPMMAPVAGGILTDAFGWQSNFVAVGLIGIVILWAVCNRLEETNTTTPTHRGLAGMIEGSRLLLRSPRFNGFAFQGAFALSVFFVFASAAPYVMVDVLGRPASEYGFYFVLVSLGFMAGNFAAGKISGTVGSDRMVIAGSLLSLAGAIVGFVLIAIGVWTPWALFGPATLVSFGSGLSLPNAQAGALGVRPKSAGTASGLSGFLQMTIAAVFAQIVGVLQNDTPYPMVILMVIAASLSVVALLVGLARDPRSEDE